MVMDTVFLPASGPRSLPPLYFLLVHKKYPPAAIELKLVAKGADP